MNRREHIDESPVEKPRYASNPDDQRMKKIISGPKAFVKEKADRFF
jgi:hypothetical protein